MKNKEKWRKLIRTNSLTQKTSWKNTKKLRKSRKIQCTIKENKKKTLPNRNQKKNPKRKKNRQTILYPIYIYIYIYNIYIYIYIYSPRFAWGGRPHRKFFGSVLAKILKMLQKIFFAVFFWLFSFKNKPRNLYMFGHKVGPKHRFLQCCFNLLFKNNIIHTFFSIKLVQSTVFCIVFNTLTSQIPWKHCYLQCFISFLSVFPLPETSQVRFSAAGNLPKRPKNSSPYLLDFRHAKIVQKSRKHHPIPASVRNRFCPPPAKADIATAKLTSVTWAFSVAVCAPISTSSPPKRCGRIFLHVYIYIYTIIYIQI